MKSAQLSEVCSLVFALIFPTFLTWVYFVLLADQSAIWQQAAYSVGKLVQFAWPLLWVFVIQQRRIAWHWPAADGLGWGLGFGMLVAGHALIIYFGYLRSAEFMVPVAEAVQAKITGMGLDTRSRYVALAIFYAIGHSFLEEYYWRWFVFGELRRLGTVSTAVGVSSFFFALHHVILLGTFFGFASPFTWVFSAAVAVGGIVWAMIYARSGSVLGPWLSHLVIDAMIFAIGYDLAAPVLS